LNATSHCKVNSYLLRRIATRTALSESENLIKDTTSQLSPLPPTYRAHFALFFEASLDNVGAMPVQLGDRALRMAL
jgi:hypothetical protein